MSYPGKSELKPLLIFLIFFSFACGAVSQNRDGRQETVLDESLISITDTVSSRDSLIIVRDLIVSVCDSTQFLQTIYLGKDSITVYSCYQTVKVYDTTIVRQDTLYSFNQKVFKKIEDLSRKENLFGRIVKSVVVFDNNNPNLPGNTPENPGQTNFALTKSDHSFLIHEDKIIDSIKIIVLDPLGYELGNSTSRPRSILEKSGNFIHLRSKNIVIKNRLLFSRGERLNPFLLAESERLIRGLKAVYDARVLVKERLTTGDTVDILVTVQDIFSISAGVGLDLPRNIGEFSFQEVNFLGLGHLLDYRYKYNPEMPGKHDHLISYSIANISNSFLSAGAFYRIQQGELSLGAGINRELVTAPIKWIGGINFRSYRFPYREGLTIREEFRRDTLSFSQNDIWLGHVSRLFISEEKAAIGKRFIVAGRLLTTDYSLVPSDNGERVSPFEDSRFYLGSAGVFFRRTYKDRYIFRYGRTEDIPEGYYYSLVGGVLDASNSLNPYAGVMGGWGRYFNRAGYLFMAAGAGSFREKTKLDRGVLTFKGLYFTPVINMGKWKLRKFAALRFTTGVNQPDAILEINNNHGVRGFSSFDLRGDRKLVLNLETNIFAPFNIVGFRFAFVAFADLAWIDSEAFRENFFPGYGIGLKFRNDHLIFDAIQVLFGYYPNAHLAGAKNFHFFQRSYSFFTFNDFNYSRPGILPFN